METQIAVMESPVKRAAKTAREVAPDALKRVFETAESARTELSNLLPIEQGQREKLGAVAHTNTHKVAVLAAMQATDEKYAEFPTESLTWRDEKGLPALVPFSLDQNTAVFHSSGYVDRSVPESVRIIYSDVNQTLANALTKKNSAMISAANKLWLKLWPASIPVGWILLFLIPASDLETVWKVLLGIMCTVLCLIPSWYLAEFICERKHGKAVEAYQVRAAFDGLIPEAIRQKIRRALSLGIFKEIFILAEVPGLEIEIGQKPRLAQVGDPLVIGYDGSGLWLIAAFDTSPVEAMAIATNPRTVG